jgi:hypothetical protein
MREDDLSYLRRRAEEEVVRSHGIDDPAIATVHEQLAKAYSKRVKQLVANPQAARSTPNN